MITPVSAEASSNPVDVSVLAALVGDEPSVILDFLLDFRNSATKALRELQSASHSGEIVKAGAVAHRLKSSSRSVGALALGDLCAELEEAARADEVKVVSALLARIETEMVCVDAYLDSYLTP